MKLSLNFALTLCFATKLISGNNSFLIQDYLRVKQLTTLLFISCSNETLSIESLRSEQGVWINIWDISDESMLIDFNYNNFFDRYSHPYGVVLNLECNEINALLLQLSKRILFHNERFWLLFTSDLERPFTVLRPQKINVDAEIILAVPNRDETHDIYEVYKVASTRGGETNLNITQLGNWNKFDGFNLPGKQTKIERRRDLRGITLSTVVTLASIPNGTTYLQHLQSEELTHLDSMHRMTYRLCIVMMDMYNFKIHIRLTNVWASSDSAGRWYGAIGLINRSEVDLSITSFRLHNERYGVFEYTTHWYHNHVQFMFLHPKSIDTVSVWLQPFKSYTGKPRLASTRILAITMILFSILMFLFYSSFIVGSLLTDPPKNIKTVRQLMQSPFKFKVDVVPYISHVFHLATEPDIVQLYNKIMTIPEIVLVPLPTGVHLMKQGGVVFATDGSYANIYMRNVLTDSEKCQLQSINLIDKFTTGMPVPNKSPFKEMIRISIRRITETGILSYYNKVWSGTNIKPKCEHSGPVFFSVDIEHFSSAVLMVIIGIASSLAILILEQISHHFLKRRMLKLS